MATRGAVAGSSADTAHYPGTYAAGNYNGLHSTIAGRRIENESLVNLPDWLVLRFSIDDGRWLAIDDHSRRRGPKSTAALFQADAIVEPVALPVGHDPFAGYGDVPAVVVRGLLLGRPGFRAWQDPSAPRGTRRARRRSRDGP